MIQPRATSSALTEAAPTNPSHSEAPATSAAHSAPTNNAARSP
jgi:hypothetical protein